MKKKTFYITTPIYYPSGNLHVGHLYSTSIAQVMTNYKKACGYETLFLTGTDEHGQKIQQKAHEHNMTPQTYVDNIAHTYKNLWAKLGINYDIFMRTTAPFHIEACKKIFTKLLDKGIIYLGKYEGLYSISDEEFFTETQAVKRDGKFYSPVSNHELQKIEESSYFLKMGLFTEWLIDYFDTHPDFVNNKTVNELKQNFLHKGLDDLSITRTTFDWGIPVRENPEHVMYVWIDALCNYITALGYLQPDDTQYQKFWVNGDEKMHIVGKEITRFHCIYWPIILKSLGVPLPDKIFSHGWLVTRAGKMSKSKGNVIDPLEQITKYSHEVIRYYMLSQIATSEDGIYDEKDLVTVFNADLANNYGNLLSRTLKMTHQFFGETPKFQPPTEQIDVDLLTEITTQFAKFCQRMEKVDIFNALKAAMHLSKSLNKYIDTTQPWTLKEATLKGRLSTILNNLLNGVYAVSAMLQVVMPERIALAETQLGVKLTFDQIADFRKFDQAVTTPGEILFARKKVA